MAGSVMRSLVYIVIHKPTGRTIVLYLVGLDGFDFGPDPSVWRIC